MATIAVTARRGGTRGVLDPFAELTACAEDLAELADAVIDAASPAARQAILDSVAAARGSLSFSGMNATLDVAEQTVHEGTRSTAKLTAIPAGPWAIVEAGTKAHDIVRRRGMPTGKRTLANLSGVYSAVSHPGAAGRHVWDPACDGADRAADVAVEAVADEVGKP